MRILSSTFGNAVFAAPYHSFKISSDGWQCIYQPMVVINPGLPTPAIDIRRMIIIGIAIKTTCIAKTIGVRLPQNRLAGAGLFLLGSFQSVIIVMRNFMAKQSSSHGEI
jgi:hypothetical protein